MLSEEQIIKFQSLYKRHFCKDINREEAQKLGVALLRLVELVYRPMTKDEYKQIKKRKENH